MQLHLGTARIECRWSSGVIGSMNSHEGQPCTVNKTKVQECQAFEPNYTNVTIEYQAPPTSPNSEVSKIEVEVAATIGLRGNDWHLRCGSPAMLAGTNFVDMVFVLPKASWTLSLKMRRSSLSLIEESHLSVEKDQVKSKLCGREIERFVQGRRA
eukprot:3269557-Amphidinium_carterae.1